MAVSRKEIEHICGKLGFKAGPVEKVLRLKELLKEIFAHPFLRERMVLNGGTAINLHYFDLARLSVDIDLNYIGSVDLAQTKKERPGVEEALIRIVKDRGYEIKHGPTDDHAGGKWILKFENVYGSRALLELDVNYMYRIPIWSPDRVELEKLYQESICRVEILCFEELMAGKISALIQRVAVRDIYDIYRFLNWKGNYEAEKIRKLSIIFAAAGRKDIRNFDPNLIKNIQEEDFKRELHPMLPAQKRVGREELLGCVIPFIKDLLSFEEKEKSFLNLLLDNAEYHPELIFNDSEIVDKLKRHPVVLWKRLNVEKFSKGG